MAESLSQFSPSICPSPDERRFLRERLPSPPQSTGNLASRCSLCCLLQIKATLMPTPSVSGIICKAAITSNTEERLLWPIMCKRSIDSAIDDGEDDAVNAKAIGDRLPRTKAEGPRSRRRFEQTGFDRKWFVASEGLPQGRNRECRAVFHLTRWLHGASSAPGSRRCHCRTTVDAHTASEFRQAGSSLARQLRGKCGTRADVLSKHYKSHPWSQMGTDRDDR